MTSLKIAVYGVGGVGGYFGATLARAGNPVSLIARGEHLQAIRDHGLTIATPKEEFTMKPVVASDSPADIGPVDIVLVGVKAWQVVEAAKTMRPLLKPDTRVVPLQNGVEAVDDLAKVLGARARPRRIVPHHCLHRRAGRHQDRPHGAGGRARRS